MSNLIPTTWRNSVDQVRENVMDAFDRWMPKRLRQGRENEEFIWPGTLLAQGGPAIDVSEDENAVHVTAELPGLSEKDFNVELLGDRLVLRGEKKTTREEKKRNYYFSECGYGSFTRTVPMPAEIDAEKAQAKYKHGVLTVTLPKTEQAKAKRVKVEVK